MAVQSTCFAQVHHAALAHRAGFTTLRRTVPDGSLGEDRTAIADAIANGTTVNFGGVGIGAGGERVRCWALDDFRLGNVSLLKIDAARAAVRRSLICVPPGSRGSGSPWMRVKPPSVHYIYV